MYLIYKTVNFILFSIYDNHRSYRTCSVPFVWPQLAEPLTERYHYD